MIGCCVLRAARYGLWLLRNAFRDDLDPRPDGVSVTLCAFKANRQVMVFVTTIVA